MYLARPHVSGKALSLINGRGYAVSVMEESAADAWRVFVLMPFRKELTPLYEEGICEGARRVGATAERVEQQKFDGDILARIVEQIETANVVLAVLMGNNPNVMYEVGLAHGLHKRVVLVTDKPEEIPFDLEHFQSVIYRGNNADLAGQIAEKIEWCRTHPSALDDYCMAYRDALKQVASVDEGLFPFLVPLAHRKLGDWALAARQLIGSGSSVAGPDRLAISESLVLATQHLRIIDPFVGDPTEVHSKDWVKFYDRMSARPGVEKAWFLCVDMAEVCSHPEPVRATHEFYSKRGFATFHCKPEDIVESTGETAPERVIEDYGDFVKLISVAGGSYKKGPTPNVLLTTLRTASHADKRLFECIRSCAEVMDAAWLQRHCPVGTT